MSDNIQELRQDWALALMSQGLIIKLSVHRWGATSSINFHDLGLKFIDDDSKDFMKKYINLGSQKLLPPEELRKIRAIDGKARNNLKNHSFNTVWGRFVPVTAFDSWKEENDKIHREFIECAKSIGRRYNSIVESVKADYRNLARDVWARLYPNNKEDVNDSFVEHFVEEIINKIPTREDLVASFKYNVVYISIPMPSVIENDIAKAQETKRKSEMAVFKQELEKRTQERIADEYIKKKEELIDDFLESTVSSMRKYVSDLCDNVLQSIARGKKSGHVNKNHINKLRHMVKKIRLLNFYDDIEIQANLDDLDQEIHKFKDERDNGLIVNTLEKIVKIGSESFVPDFNPAISSLEL